MTATNRFRPTLDGLDDRSLMSATLSNGLLNIVGTGAGDQIQVTQTSPGRCRVTVSGTGEAATFDLSRVNKIVVHAGGGNDFVTIATTITKLTELRGMAGDDTLLGGGGRDFIYGGGGNDKIDGRSGSDVCDGGGGNDKVNGGAGANTCTGGGGNDTVHPGGVPLTPEPGRLPTEPGVNPGTPSGTSLTAVLAGGGTADFSNGVAGPRFNVFVTNVPLNGAANAFGSVFVDGVPVGEMSLDQGGNGALRLPFADAGPGGFPAGFPQVRAGSVVTVEVNGTVVRRGTLTGTVGNTPNTPNTPATGVLSATLSGGGGSATYRTGSAGASFRLDVAKVPLNNHLNGVAAAFVDGVLVGEMSIDGGGFGGLQYGPAGQHGEIPAGFPVIRVGSVLTVEVDGFVVSRGTFGRTA